MILFAEITLTTIFLLLSISPLFVVDETGHIVSLNQEDLE